MQFDDSRARTYKKRIEVLAFRSDDSVSFHKPWGEQDIRGGGWVIVPLAENGGATGDIYGCDADTFVSTYEPSPSLRPNRFRKKETIRAYQPGNEFQVDTILSDGHVEVQGAKAGSYDTWIVKAPGGEVYPVESAEFLRTYVEVLEKGDNYRIKSRDEHWAADGTPKRILALDGGGVRGILSLGYLEHIETLLRERHGNSDEFRLSHYFDLIAGTSTGAIIAAALAKGMSVAEVRALYESLAGSVFKRFLLRRGLIRAKFSAKALHSYLKQVFANNTMGSHSIQTGLLIVAKRLDTGSVWPMSNNPSNRFFTAKNKDAFFSNEDYPLRTVVRASTAAPSYFAPERIEISKEGDHPHGEFIDGGVSPHNNPALLALQLVTLKGFGAEWPLDPDKLLLVSVGTGSAPTGTSNSWFAASHAIKALRSLMDDCAESVETMLQWLSNSPTARTIDAAMEDLSSDLLTERPLIQYLRYNVHLESDWLKENLNEEISESKVESLREMDRPENMEALSKLGKKAAESQIKNNHFPPEFDLGG
jgi:patatin-like phospholipase/acyl hydrolase